MRKLLVFASLLAVAGAFGYRGIKQVEGKTTELPAAEHQTRAVVEATHAFLTSLSVDQRQKVQFAFTPQKLGTNAPFHRTADGGVAPGAPAGSSQGRPGGGAVGPGKQAGGTGRSRSRPG